MSEYIYQDRAVIFLDVLGFQETLKSFEREAVYNAYNFPEKYENPISEKANDFIDTFKSVINLLEEIDFNYYLFSDNICITVDYVENKDFLVEILFMVSELFYHFAQKGYFLRGGIDIGKFIDDNQIAIGMPLANAYVLENKVAVFPRIIISEQYKKTLDQYASDKLIGDGNIHSMKYLINKSCELYYLNVFYGSLTYGDKVEYFGNLKKVIENSLRNNSSKEEVYIKYKWLAEEFNNFLDNYSHDQYLIEIIEQDLSVNEIKKLKNLRI